MVQKLSWRRFFEGLKYRSLNAAFNVVSGTESHCLLHAVLSFIVWDCGDVVLLSRLRMNTTALYIKKENFPTNTEPVCMLAGLSHFLVSKKKNS